MGPAERTSRSAEAVIIVCSRTDQNGVRRQAGRPDDFPNFPVLRLGNCRGSGREGTLLQGFRGSAFRGVRVRPVLQGGFSLFAGKVQAGGANRTARPMDREYVECSSVMYAPFSALAAQKYIFF